MAETLKNLKITLKDLNNNSLFPKTTVSAVEGLDNKIESMVNAGIAANDAMVFKGTLGTGGTVTALPAVAFSGWTYRVVEAGTYNDHKCEIGDLVICVGNNSVSGSEPSESYWTVVQTNIDGAVISEKSLEEDLVVLGGGNQKVKTDATLTIGTKDNSYVYIENGKFKEGTLTVASTTAAGLMSATDKTDLNNLKTQVEGLTSTGGEANQNAFSYISVNGSTIEAAQKTDTLILQSGDGVTLTVGSTVIEETTYGVLTINGQVYSEATSAVPAQGTEGDEGYVPAKSATGGLMSASDKEKLDKLSEALIVDGAVKPSIEASDLVPESGPVTAQDGKLVLNLGTGLSTDSDGKLYVDVASLDLAGDGIKEETDGKLSVDLATEIPLIEEGEDAGKIDTSKIEDSGLGLAMVDGKLAATILFEIDGEV